MDHGGREIRNRDWLKSGEGAGYTSVSYSVSVCTRLSSSVANKCFHGFCYHLESGHNKPDGRMEYMANTADELSVLSNVGIHF